MEPDMEYMRKTPRGFIVPRETLEYFEQTAIWSRMALELLNAYGPTDQVLGIIQDCQQNGFPRALFDLNR